MPGQFMIANEIWNIMELYVRGKEIRRIGVEITAWVLPHRTAEGRQILQEVTVS